MKSPAYIAIAALLAFPLSTMSATALAADAAHSHGHSHGHEVHGTMELNRGEKWETDAALRQGMGALHQIVSTGLDGARTDALTADGYKK